MGASVCHLGAKGCRRGAILLNLGVNLRYMVPLLPVPCNVAMETNSGTSNVD